MTERTTQQREPGVYEYERVTVDVGAYFDALRLSRSDVLRTLKITRGQLDTWRQQGAMPRAVWRRCVNTWGGHGMTPKHSTVRKPYRLPALYEAMPGVKKVVLPPPPPVAVPPAPEPVAPPAPPATVPWAVFESTMALLMHQNAALLTEKAVVEADNLHLHKVVALFKAEIGFEASVHAIDAADRTNRVPVPAPDVRAEVRQHLQALSQYNGNGAVLSDLEKRLPK